jgi:hypothetical protein
MSCREALGFLPATESVVLPPFSGIGRMPAYQSAPDFSLTEQYHMKAVGCEQRAERANDRTTEREWRLLAAQWRSMADQAAAMSGEASAADFAR